jgi:hypothetical protein
MFDHSRAEWYPETDGYTIDPVMTSGRTPRPPLRVPMSTFAVHYAGAGSSWLDEGDTGRELRSIEVNHARPTGKPNEYNSVSDISAETWEYAGPYRAAHSAGNNSTVWGHLVLYGLERLNDWHADRLIMGIRRARAQAVAAGWLTADHVVAGHRDLPNARTPCPGLLRTNRTWWNRITAPLAADLEPGDTAMQAIRHTDYADQFAVIRLGPVTRSLLLELGMDPDVVTTSSADTLDDLLTAAGVDLDELTEL